MRGAHDLEASSDLVIAQEVPIDGLGYHSVPPDVRLAQGNFIPTPDAQQEPIVLWRR
jgi:hypothetical protein